MFFPYVCDLRSQISRNHLRKNILVSLQGQLCKSRRSAFFKGLKIKWVYEILGINEDKKKKIKERKKQTRLDISCCINEYQKQRQRQKHKKKYRTLSQLKEISFLILLCCLITSSCLQNTVFSSRPSTNMRSICL